VTDSEGLLVFVCGQNNIDTVSFVKKKYLSILKKKGTYYRNNLL